jgi:pimeloyl-ACP methyl ester carboxylesterase
VHIDVESRRIAGNRVRWRVAGSGPPLVLVHGLAGSWRWWRTVLPALAAERRVHLLDLPGFGGLPRARLFDLDRALDWLEDWSAAADIGPADVVGHSLGGLLCARLAARRPEAVRRLVLVAPAGLATHSAVGSAVPLAIALLRCRPRFLALLTRDALRSGPIAIGSAALAVVAADLRTDLPAVRAPTLVLLGERDPLVPHAHAEDLGEVHVHVLRGAGHVPMVDRPAEFSRVLLAFLRETG